MRRAGVLAAALFCLAPTAGRAHVVGARFGDFAAGALHPLTGLQSVVAILALGLLAGLQEPRTAPWILLAAPSGLLLGAAAVTIAPALLWPATVCKASFVALGLLVAADARLSAPALALIGAPIAAAHGYDNGLAILEGAKPVPYALGVATAGLLALALITGAACWLVRRAQWLRIGARALGSWIAATGLMVLAL